MNVNYIQKVHVMHVNILKQLAHKVLKEFILFLSKNNCEFYIHCVSSKKKCSLEILLTVTVSCIDAVFDQNDSKESTLVGSTVVGE